MERQKGSLIILVFVNITAACFVQAICSSILSEMISMSLFQFVVFPLIFILINIAMALKFKFDFFLYSVFCFLGFLCSIVVLAFIRLIVERPQELPPGEIVLGADLVFIFFISFVQFVVFLFLNLIIYILYKSYKCFHMKGEVPPKRYKRC